MHQNGGNLHVISRCTFCYFNNIVASWEYPWCFIIVHVLLAFKHWDKTPFLIFGITFTRFSSIHGFRIVAQSSSLPLKRCVTSTPRWPATPVAVYCNWSAKQHNPFAALAIQSWYEQKSLPIFQLSPSWCPQFLESHLLLPPSLHQ